MAEVTSPRNRIVREVRRAIREGGLTASGCCVAEGPRLLDEALRSHRPIEAALVSEACADRYAARLNGARMTVLSASDFDALAATEASQGIIALVEPPAASPDAIFLDGALVLALDGVQDPGNAGAMLRAAEAFGANGAVFLKGSVNPYNPKAVRASAGSIFRLSVLAACEESRFLGWASEAGLDLYAAMPRDGQSSASCDFTRGCAIVIGGEGGGVRASLRSRARGVSIASRSVESLNAAVAAAILLYEASRQRAGRSA